MRAHTHARARAHTHTHTHTLRRMEVWGPRRYSLHLCFSVFFVTPPNNAVSCILFLRAVGVVGGACARTMRACVCVCVCVCASKCTTTFGSMWVLPKVSRTWIFELSAARIHAFTEKDYILRNEYNNIPSSPPSTVPIPSLPPFFIRVRARILPRASKNIVPVFFSLSSRPMHLAPGLLHPDDAYGQLIEERHCILFFFESFINAFFLLQFLSPSQLLVCCMQ